MIVVVIIGIVSTTLVPTFAQLNDEACESNLRANLRLVRGAIERYALEHHGAFPSAVGDGVNAANTYKSFLTQLTQYTDAEGRKSNRLDRTNFPYGPYLKAIPQAPLGPAKGDKRVNISNTGGGLEGFPNPKKGWRYDSSSGDFIFNFNGLSCDGVTNYDSW